MRVLFASFVISVLTSSGSFAFEGKPISSSNREPASIRDPLLTPSGKKLEDQGINFDLILKEEWNRNFAGGLKQQSEFLGNIDFKLAIDAEKLMGWKGGSAFFYVINNHGKKPSLNVGDFQWTSNIEAITPQTKLYEAWIQQLLFDDEVSFLFGLHDLNSEFYVTDGALLFLHSAFGIGSEMGQLNVDGGGPSIFPSTSMAFRARYEPTKNFFAQVAAFNAQAGDPSNPGRTVLRIKGSDGALVIGEAAYQVSREDKTQSYRKFGIGAWTYTRKFQNQVDSSMVNNQGAYFIGENSFNDSVSVFLNYGISTGAVNPTDSCLTTGVTVKGLLPGRPDDRFGLGYVRNSTSSEYRQTNAGSTTHESVAEAVYRMEVSKGVSLIPDLQYVIHPGFAESVQDATVGAVRLELTF